MFPFRDFNYVNKVEWAFKVLFCKFFYLFFESKTTHLRALLIVKIRFALNLNAVFLTQIFLGISLSSRSNPSCTPQILIFVII